MSCNISKQNPGIISFARHKLGLSQQQLADSLGVSRSLVAMVETGKRKFPPAVAAIYLDMCKTAVLLNPEGFITIKRGRKPAVTLVPSVTNYNSHREKVDPEIPDIVLLLQKSKLSYLYTGLQFKKENTKKRFQEFSDQQMVVRAMLDVYAGLRDSLPEGKLRDKYELRSAEYHVKQIKLKQQLKKCDAVALLQMEYQMGMLKGQIELAEKTLAALNNDREHSLEIAA